MQLDIELFFRKPSVSEGPLPPELLAENGQIACSKSGAGTRGVFGPFGILVLATEDLEEQTAIFFHFVHSRTTGWRTVVCSDQSRFGRETTLKWLLFSQLGYFPYDMNLMAGHQCPIIQRFNPEALVDVKNGQLKAIRAALRLSRHLVHALMFKVDFIYLFSVTYNPQNQTLRRFRYIWDTSVPP